MGKAGAENSKMMRYLLDTDVIIDHLRGEVKARSFLKQSLLSNTALYYSVISKAEIYSGVRQGEEEDVAILLRSMSEVPIDGRVAEDAGRYRNIFYSSHGLFLPDALIAASAKRAGATLITLNKKHYPMKDIEIQIPYTKSAKIK